MKKRLILIFLSLGLLLFVTTSAYAENNFFQRQQKQRQRIKMGVKDGSLVPFEVRELRQEQRHIKRLMKQFLQDGRLNKKERKQLRRLQRRAGENIYRLRHNRHRVIRGKKYPDKKWRHPHDEFDWHRSRHKRHRDDDFPFYIKIRLEL